MQKGPAGPLLFMTSDYPHPDQASKPVSGASDGASCDTSR